MQNESEMIRQTLSAEKEHAEKSKRWKKAFSPVRVFHKSQIAQRISRTGNEIGIMLVTYKIPSSRCTKSFED
ncbi:hypothetical protein CEXT_763021 [Caerostris extrusa]|uniref:Uncharacterized protein n=1 Tax=Caerostris extrusa TaxID=172846 RepID=A0AAV4XU71_CAEEX|nr:hypothetical protein CEXT_763021 [Caerostris extrusa]